MSGSLRARQHCARARSRRLFLEQLENRVLLAALAPLGLVSWYRAEGNANDFANGNSGTLQNGATFAAGQVGQAFNLDATDDFVQVPSSANLNITGDITVEGWINPTASGLREIVSKRSPDGNDVNINLHIQADGHLAWASRSGGGAFELIETPAAIPLNTF